MDHQRSAPSSSAPAGAAASAAQQAASADALCTAVGLAWGWLDQGQPAQALTLVRACLACWPSKAVLHLLHRHCLVELGLPLPEAAMPGAQRLPPSWRALLDKLDARRQMGLDARGAAAPPH
jgi:hypothetical protein